jgi:membrane fusion protein (multidrug efflux system)
VQPIAAVAQPEAVVAKPQASKRKLVFLTALAIVALGSGARLYSQRAIISTDDAQIDADVVAVPARIAGSVQAVRFEENQQVTAGQLLAELDSAPAEAKLAQAAANLAAAEAAAHAADVQAQRAQTNARTDLAVANAGLRNWTVGAASTLAQIAEADARRENALARLAEADLNLARSQSLFQSGAASNAQLDQARTAQQVARTELARSDAALATVKLSRDQAQSRVAEAQAKLSQSDQVDAIIREAGARADQAHAAVETAKAQKTLAALELSYTKIYAPQAGVVSKKNVNLGQSVSVGQSIVQLVPNTLWVTANFKETQIDHLRIGHPVTLSVDAYPELKLSGVVASFSGATGSRFALLPPDNATGNYTKVVQRLSVRVRLANLPTDIALRPGMSVEVHVDTQGPVALVSPSAPSEPTHTQQAITPDATAHAGGV